MVMRACVSNLSPTHGYFMYNIRWESPESNIVIYLALGKVMLVMILAVHKFYDKEHFCS